MLTLPSLESGPSVRNARLMTCSSSEYHLVVQAHHDHRCQRPLFGTPSWQVVQNTKYASLSGQSDVPRSVSNYGVLVGCVCRAVTRSELLMISLV